MSSVPANFNLRPPAPPLHTLHYIPLHKTNVSNDPNRSFRGKSGKPIRVVVHEGNNWNNIRGKVVLDTKRLLVSELCGHIAPSRDTSTSTSLLACPSYINHPFAGPETTQRISKPEEKFPPLALSVFITIYTFIYLSNGSPGILTGPEFVLFPVTNGCLLNMDAKLDSKYSILWSASNIFPYCIEYFLKIFLICLWINSWKHNEFKTQS